MDIDLLPEGSESVTFSDEESEISEEEVDYMETIKARNCFGYGVTTKKKKVRYGLLDALDITIRFTTAIGLAVAFFVYVDLDFLQTQFPGYSVLAINAGFIMDYPYAGAAASDALSWCFGSYFGILVAMLSIVILQTDEREATLEVILECDGGIQTQTGPVQDPSPFLIAFFIFFHNFFLSYLSQNGYWSSGSLIAYNVYVLAWFRSVKTPLANRLDFFDFCFSARGSCIGILWGTLFLLLPFFRWNAKPRGVLMPRFAIPKAIGMLHGAANDLNDLVAAVSAEYQADNVFKVKEESFIQKNIALSFIQKKIRDAQALLNTSGKWEPIISLKPIRFQMLLDYSDLLLQISFQIDSMVLLFKSKLKKHTPDRPKFEVLDDHELIASMQKLQSLMASVFEIIQKNGKGNEELTHSLEIEMEKIRWKIVDLFEDVEIPDKWTADTSEQAFHCSLIWKYHGLYRLVTRVNQTFYKPYGKKYWERVMDWGIIYFEQWRDYIKDFVKLIVIKRQFSKWAYDRYDPLFGSCQIAISALIASLFTLIPDLRINTPNSITILTTATLIMNRDNATAHYAKSFLRLSGTALAVGAAFLIFVIFPEGNSTGTMVFVIAYAFTARFIQYHSDSPYIYSTFMISLLTVLFEVSPIPQILNVNISTVRRAAATTLGVVIACLANILWPIQSRALLRMRMGKTMHSNFIPLLQVIFSDTDGTIDDKKLSNRLTKAMKSISKQQGLIDSAAAEPAILSDVFCSEPFTSIVSIQNRIMIDLFATLQMNRSLCQLIKSDKVNDIIFNSTKTQKFEHLVVHRMSDIIRAIEVDTYVPLHKKSLIGEYYKWVSHIVHSIKGLKLSGQVKMCLWAYLMNCLFVVENIVKLQNRVDLLKEYKRFTKQPGFPIGRYPTIVPAKRKIKQANFFNDE